MKKLLFVSLVAAALSAPAWAAPKTVILKVPGMTCAACPITVRTALSRVPGVEGVQVNFRKKLASVRYDDAKTTVAALQKATADAGYPAKPIGDGTNE
ncbi:MAG: mercury resistance system periplasmic binding protein MerP [Gammaproteobacteria bacterium]|nr:mercury resistance system periplasmic binding protein MerP [Gammaproteobacteria bacterium]